MLRVIPICPFLLAFFCLLLTVGGGAEAKVDSDKKPLEAKKANSSFQSEYIREIPEIWKWCSAEPTFFKDVQVLFANYPLTRGRDFNVIIRGEAQEPMDKITVKSRITLSGFISVTDVQDLCTLPGRSCPLPAGYQEQKLTYPIPATAMGSVTAKSVMYSGSTPIACMKIGPLTIRRQGENESTVKTTERSERAGSRRRGRRIAEVEMGNNP